MPEYNIDPSPRCAYCLGKVSPLNGSHTDTVWVRTVFMDSASYIGAYIGREVPSETQEGSLYPYSSTAIPDGYADCCPRFYFGGVPRYLGVWNYSGHSLVVEEDT